MYIDIPLAGLIQHPALQILIQEKLHVQPNEYALSYRQLAEGKPISLGLAEALFCLYADEHRFDRQLLEACSIEELTFFLQQSHAYYLEKKLPALEQSAKQVLENCVESETAIAGLCMFFDAFRQRLVAHFRHEEQVFFPYVHDLLLLQTQPNNTVLRERLNSPFSAQHFIEKHEHIEEELHVVSSLIRANSMASFLPMSYRIFLNQLHFFEIDLNHHALIEDDVLLPKVLELERSLRANVDRLLLRNERGS